MSVVNLQKRLARRLRWQKQAHQLEKSDRVLIEQLPGLRAWQSRRLAGSFAHFMLDPSKRLAAQFFLSDLYGDADFMQRDEEAAKILPKMARILPDTLLQAAVDAIELSVLSHALDMRMARTLSAMGVKPGSISAGDYQTAYRKIGLRRLRERQINLVLEVGERLDSVIKIHGIGKLLAASRLPARMLGLAHLQGFLERGFTAFNHLGGADSFLTEIHQQESCIARRLREGHARPFEPPFS
jgi:hypothetical protein